MKVAILTWFADTLNYGSMLQAYALQNFLVDKGHEVDFIYYKSIASDLEYPPLLMQYWNRAKYRLKKIKLQKSACYYEEAKISCKNFVENNINKSRLIIGIDELKNINGDYDCFICGSDQIWSLNKNYNPVYFLTWVEEGKKKISYAPSIPLSYVNERKKEFLKKSIYSFNAISVREKRSAKIISDILGQTVVDVLDPTLLVDKSFWKSKLVDISCQGEQYILCYFLSDRAYYIDVVKKISEDTDNKVLVIPTEISNPELYGVPVLNVGPLDFISYIKYAQIVLTDSYHASIFSLVFEKVFYILERFDKNAKTSQNDRIYDLADKFELNDRIISENDNYSVDRDVINYSRINELHEHLRILSDRFLMDSLDS